MAASILVFDTGPLSHFAINNWLGVLKAVVGERQALIPETVAAELKEGVTHDGRIAAVLKCDWIEHRALSTEAELREYAFFAQRLVVGQRNTGEAGVLALGKTLGADVVIDDGAARKAAEGAGLSVVPTLRLLCNSIRDGLLTVEVVEHLVDDLIHSAYRLPFAAGEFRIWALKHNLI